MKDLSKDMNAQIIQIISTYMDITDLSMSFANLGINSLSFIELLVALENEFEFEFDDDMLLIEEFPTVKDLVDYVQSICCDKA